MCFQPTLSPRTPWGDYCPPADALPEFQESLPVKGKGREGRKEGKGWKNERKDRTGEGEKNTLEINFWLWPSIVRVY